MGVSQRERRRGGLDVADWRLGLEAAFGRLDGDEDLEPDVELEAARDDVVDASEQAREHSDRQLDEAAFETTTSSRYPEREAVHVSEAAWVDELVLSRYDAEQWGSAYVGLAEAFAYRERRSAAGRPLPDDEAFRRVASVCIKRSIIRDRRRGDDNSNTSRNLRMFPGQGRGAKHGRNMQGARHWIQMHPVDFDTGGDDESRHPEPAREYARLGRERPMTLERLPWRAQRCIFRIMTYRELDFLRLVICGLPTYRCGELVGFEVTVRPHQRGPQWAKKSSSGAAKMKRKIQDKIVEVAAAFGLGEYGYDD